MTRDPRKPSIQVCVGRIGLIALIFLVFRIELIPILKLMLGMSSDCLQGPSKVIVATVLVATFLT